MRKLIAQTAALVRPTEGNVFVKGLKATETKGGLAIPDTYQEENPRAMVVAIHPKSEVEYKAGDIVHIIGGAGVMPMKFDGDDYFLLTEECILAYVVEE